MVSEYLAIAQEYIKDIAIGIIIILAGFALGILVKKVAYRILREINLNKIMSNVGVTVNLEQWISILMSYVIYLFTVVFFLQHLGITSVVLYIIVGAILALLILTFLVGLKDVIPNFVAWLLLQRKGKMVVGRRVDVKEISGVVEKIGYLETEIRTERGDTLYVPNNLFLKTKFWIKN